MPLHGESTGTDPGEIVDASLIDVMLELTPEDRLRHNDRMLRMIEELRDALADREDGPLDPGR